MSFKNLTALLLLFISACLPVGGALFFAYQQAKDQEIRYLSSLAEEVARRASDTRSQMVSAFEELKKDNVQCDSAGIAKMQGISIKSTYLQGVGVYRDGNIVCSSFGRLEQGISLGKGQGRTATGIQAWVDVELPLASRQKFNIYERDGYITLVHPGQVVDVMSRPDVSLAVVVSKPKFVARSKGNILPKWISAYQPNQTETLQLGVFLVSYHAVPEHNIAGLAASNQSAVWQHFSEFAKFLVPLGVLTSLLLFIGTTMLLKRNGGVKARLLAALKNKEFFLLYQPIFDIHTNQCVGAEALLRWLRQDGAIDEPLLFIPAMEKHGLISKVTEYVMHKAAHDMRPIIEQHPAFRLSINFSPKDVETGGPVLEVPDMIKRMGATPCNLIIEITERNALDAVNTRQAIDQMRQSGVSIMIDDFGTGYSNLATLQSIHVDGLKMDRIFTESIDTTAPTHTVALSIIQMARDLKLNLIAEGVETKAQLNYLKAHGVKYAQGFLLSRPITPEALMQILDQQAKSAGAHQPA